MHLFKFSKKFRLSKKDFYFPINMGKKINIMSLFNIYIILNKLTYPRLGISFYKKRIKLAHDRNIMKRIIRESFRLNKYHLPCVDLIFVLDKILNQKKLKNSLIQVWYIKCII